MARFYGWHRGRTSLSNKKIFRLFCQYVCLGYKKNICVVVVWVKILNTKLSVLFWRLLDSLALALTPIFLNIYCKVKDAKNNSEVNSSSLDAKAITEAKR